MSNKIIVPTLGESVTEATVSKWLKNQGESVVADEPVVELETDKVNVEVPAPSNGTLEKISVKEGETVNVGSLLGLINGSNKNISQTSKEVKDYSPPKKDSPKKHKPIEKIKSSKKTMPSIPLKEEPLQLRNEDVQEEEALILDNEIEKKINKEIPKKEKKIVISPAARKLATEANLNLNEIEGSGKNGLVLKEDIMGLMGAKPSPSERKIKHGPEERIKMTRLRLTIAKRLKEAQENAAMLTTFNEVDMSEIISMRKKI